MPTPTRVLRQTWSSTLCLPKSSFPPRPIAADRPKYLQRCTDDLYAWQRSTPELSGKKPFVLHDGPPYANGSLHIGHALNKILKDIILRVQLARGRPIEYVPGWDCHGLPIELKALQLHQERDGEPLKEQEKQGKDAVKIRKLARSLALKTVEEQRKSFREWAVLGDWENPYKTLDKDFELRQLEVFRQMLASGLIYRKFKPVYWSPSTRTALAEAELEYKDDHVSHAAFVAFKAVHGEQLARKFGLNAPGADDISFLVWTTTPWTLPANKAIAVHEHLDYVCAHYDGLGYIIVAESRLEEVEKICDISHTGPIFGPVRGSQLIGCTYKNDAFTKESTGTVLTGDYVSAESGTGLVHTAPGHGMDDYLLCLKHEIEPFAPVDDAGCFTKDAFDQPDAINKYPFVGEVVTGQGNKSVIQYLRESQDAPHGVRLVGVHKYKHKYPYDWRSKQPVIVRATAQWFANVGKIRAATLREIDNITFIPPTGKERLTSFVKNRSEWCISRQRAWGVPIPALYRNDTGDAHLTPDSVAHIIRIIQERGIDAWWTDSPDDPAWIPSDAARDCKYQRGKDTMDVWFDSGTSWTHMGKKDTGFDSKSSDIYLEGSDQHRGWFQSSLLTKVAHDIAIGSEPSSPFRTLITHGFTLDGQGKKQSKSLGNVISPDQIINGTLLPPLKRKGKKKGSEDQSVTYDALGPDALRLWVAGTDYTKDMNVGETVLKAVNGNLNKLRVTFRLLTGLLADFPYQTYRRRLHELEPVDILGMVHLSQLSGAVWKALSDHEHHKAVLALDQYINAKFSAFYMETIKDRIYTEAQSGSRRRDCQFVLWHIFEELCSILRPLTPLLVEEARSHLPSLQESKMSLAPQRILDPRDMHEDMQEHPLVLKLRSFDSLEHRLTVVSEDQAELMDLRTVVQGVQETLRSKKLLGSSLQSHVILVRDQDQNHNHGQADQLLQRLQHVWGETNLADLFVVSKVDIDPEGILLDRRLQSTDHKPIAWYDVGTGAFGVRAVVHEPVAHKCERCWKYTVEEEDVSLCSRCETVVGRNEPRGTS